jgi:putative tryptophan/tyrosine transport system substrate-binding protein
MLDVKRREFIALVGGGVLLLAAKVKRARGQQPAMPVVGWLNASSPDGYRPMVTAFRQGLQEYGYVEGQNVAIEYRWAEGRIDRLPAMAAELVQRQVAVIAATTVAAALAAKTATTTIPIIFETAYDPIRFGLVASLNRPGGNITGVTNLNVEVGPKTLELLRELIPTASVVALLLNPINPIAAEFGLRGLQGAARTLGLELQVLNASTESDFDGVFANLIQLRAGGLIIAADPFFTSRQEELAALALRHRMPAVYQGREFAAAGGLASYGGSATDCYRLAGIYVARVLKGEKPSELAVQQATKVELFLNLKTANALGITVPLPVSGRADEVIE